MKAYAKNTVDYAPPAVGAVDETQSLSTSTCILRTLFRNFRQVAHSQAVLEQVRPSQRSTKYEVAEKQKNYNLYSNNSAL